MGSLKSQIEKDLKQALLAGDRAVTDTLRIIKSVILNEEIAKNVREQGLDDDSIISLLKKEAKKRQEAADLYEKAGSQERAEKELSEKSIIEGYLPASLDDKAINKLIDEAVRTQGSVTQNTMGPIIGEVKKLSSGGADGSDIARLVRERLVG